MLARKQDVTMIMSPLSNHTYLRVPSTFLPNACRLYLSQQILHNPWDYLKNCRVLNKQSKAWLARSAQDPTVLEMVHREHLLGMPVLDVRT